MAGNRWRNARQTDWKPTVFGYHRRMRSSPRAIVLCVLVALPGLMGGATGTPTSSPGTPPPTPGGYEGREPDAPWRAAAGAAIDKHRRVAITVRVQDEAGFAVPGAEVEFIETRPAFAFGATVEASRLLSTNAANGRYQSVVTNWFGTVTLGSDLEWSRFEKDPAPAAHAIDWLGSHRIGIRGHSLVGPGTNETSHLPPDVAGLFSDPAALRTRIVTHLTNVAARFAGKLADWDVVDQPLHDTAIEGVLGRQTLADWFAIAHAVDPAATLLLVDHGNLEDTGPDGTARLRALADDLRSREAPFHTLGLPSRFAGHLTPPDEISRRLDRLAGIRPFGASFAVRITDFEVATDDEALQADYTRDFLTAAFAHPAVNGVLAGGFWESDRVQPKAAMFRADGQPKPSALVWSNLTQRAWMTRTNARASLTGSAAIRGFKGEYLVRVRANGMVKELLATVLADTHLAAVVPSAAPTIQVVPGPASHRFSWSGQGNGYVLESCESLSPPDWQPVDLIPVLSKGQWRVELPAADTTLYFRLNRTGSATPP